VLSDPCSKRIAGGEGRGAERGRILDLIFPEKLKESLDKSFRKVYSSIRGYLMTSYKALKNKVEKAGGTEAGLFIVPEWNMNNLTAKITRQGRKATELGCVPPRIEIVETVEVEFAKATGRFDLAGAEIFKTVIFNCNVLRIVGEAPKLNGWTFAAKITFGDDQGAGNLIYRVPGFEGVIPQSFRTSDARLCNHCETARTRKDVFILQHDSGEW
jgi:hypothetical protein